MPPTGVSRGSQSLPDPSFHEGRNAKIDRAIDNFVNAREANNATKETMVKRRYKLVEVMHAELPGDVCGYRYGGRSAELSTSESVKANTDKEPE